MTKTLVLVDFSSLLYVSCFCNLHLYDESERFTGGIFGILLSVCKIIKETLPLHIVICLDKKPYLRSEVYPEYKEKRKAKDDLELMQKIDESLDYGLQLCKFLGFTVWGKQGYEADDLIAVGVKKYHKEFDRVIAYSKDSDLFQLFKYPNFELLRGTLGFYTRKVFRRQFFGITPRQYVKMLCLTGTHNAVTGIYRVGDKTAIKMIKDGEKYKDIFEQNKELIDRNKSLIKLPHPSLKDLSEFTLDAKEKFNRHKLIQFLAGFDIDLSYYMQDCLVKYFN